MRDLLASPAQIGWIVLRTTAVYLVILVGLRLRGKREVGQMGPGDLALILLISNAVQNAMVGPDMSLVGGLVAACVLLGVNYVLDQLSARSKKIERLIRGAPRILVRHGTLYPQNLHAEGVTHQDLLQSLREGGCATVEHCELAVLEVDGRISVISRR